MSIQSIDWQKTPLVPAIVQDSKTHEVLMLAYMNEEALMLTLQSHVAHYYSRSKKRIWMKGEESGNRQLVSDIYLDCDDDTILLKVEQVGGVACHTGRRSCFFKDIKSDKKIGQIDTSVVENYSVTDRLYHTILERKNADPKSSYTASLLSKGDNAILKKVCEEAGEFCFAIKDKDEEEIIYEAADLIYHMLVALGSQDISPKRVDDELKRRFGLSGIEEKNSRE
jgi:phosphoribosyl-ATP pyrophosphohydrolase/phosphoribosyl-AMP cyclohydrolase